MFGIMFFIFISICGVAGAIWKTVDDVKIYKYTKNDFCGYYTDSRGTHREIGTGRPVAILKDDYKDEIMYTAKGKVIKNITEYQRHKFIEAMQNFMQNGEMRQTAYWCDLREYHENEWKNIVGPRYRDVNDGKIYIVRTFDVDGLKHRKRNYTSGMIETLNYKCNIQFYMDILTGHLVRRTDGDYRMEIENEESIDEDLKECNERKVQEFIDVFNRKQDVDAKNSNVDNFYDHFYFNNNEFKSDIFLNDQWNKFYKNNGSLEIEKEKTKVTWSH